jgi:hypothetical protein
MYSEEMNYNSKNSMELAAPEFRCLTTFFSSSWFFVELEANFKEPITNQTCIHNQCIQRSRVNAEMDVN